MNFSAMGEKIVSWVDSNHLFASRTDNKIFAENDPVPEPHRGCATRCQSSTI